MSLEIGPLSPSNPPPCQRAARPAATGLGRGLEAAASARISIPAAPPPEVLDEVGAAAERAEQLAAADRELHFRISEDTGRVVVEVRDLDGNVLRTISAAESLDVMGGASL